MGTSSDGSHEVEPDNYEPGIPVGSQASEHLSNFILGAFSLNVGYGLTDQFGLGIGLPYRVTRSSIDFLDKDGTKIPGFVSIHHRNEVIHGLGDISLVGKWSPLQSHGSKMMDFLLQAGISLPTGHIEPNPFDLSDQGKSHQHMFFGTGTYNPLIGYDFLFHTKKSFSLLNWTRIMTPLYENRFGYQAGTRIQSGLGYISGFGLSKWKFLIETDLYVEGTSKWGGTGKKAVDDDNSGRIDILIHLSAIWQLSNNLAINITGQTPLYRKVIGGQLETPILLSLEVNLSTSLF